MAGAETAQAKRSFGPVVVMEPDEFLKILNRQEEPLVVYATGGLFRARHSYLTSYKGLTFYTKSAEPLRLPPRSEIINAKGVFMAA